MDGEGTFDMDVIRHSKNTTEIITANSKILGRSEILLLMPVLIAELHNDASRT